MTSTPTRTHAPFALTRPSLPIGRARSTVEGTPLSPTELRKIDAPATHEQKAKLEGLSPEAVKEPNLAGEPIVTKLTRVPGNGAPIGGLKVVARYSWFAARPSSTEAIYKIYAESFKDEAHLDAIVSEAQQMVNNALSSSPRAARAYSQ